MMQMGKDKQNENSSDRAGNTLLMKIKFRAYSCEQRSCFAVADLLTLKYPLFFNHLRTFDRS